MERQVLKVLEKARKDQEKRLKDFKIVIELLKKEIELLKKENEYKEDWTLKSDINFWEELHEKKAEEIKIYLEKVEGLCKELKDLERWQRVDWAILSVKRKIRGLKGKQQARERREKKEG